MREFFKFLITGGSSTASHYVVFWLCLSVAAMDATTSSAVGYLFGSIVSYLLNYYYTFNSRRSHRSAVLLFYAMVSIGFIINIGVVHVFVKELTFNPWLAQICATGLTLVFNFVISKFLVFSWRKS